MDNSVSVPKSSQIQVGSSNVGVSPTSSPPAAVPTQTNNGSSSISSNSTTNNSSSVINNPGVHGDGSTVASPSSSSSSVLLLGLTSVICVSLTILATYYLYVRLRHGGGRGGLGLRRGRKRPLKLDSCRYTHLGQTEPLDDDLSDLEGHSYGIVEADARSQPGTSVTTTGRKYAQQTEYKTATLVVDSTSSADENYTSPALTQLTTPATTNTNTSFGVDVGENYWLLNGVGADGGAADEGALQSDEDLLQ